MRALYSLEYTNGHAQIRLSMLASWSRYLKIFEVVRVLLIDFFRMNMKNTDEHELCMGYGNMGYGLWVTHAFIVWKI